MKKYLIVSATSFEIAPLLAYLDTHAEKESFFSYIWNEAHITPLVTGVGAMMTSYAMATYLKIGDIDLALNVGLAGSFRTNIDKGDVVNIKSDRFGDVGVEEADGSFTDIFDLELHDKNKFPFSNGEILNERVKVMPPNIPSVKGITVNTVHGTAKSIHLIKAKYNPDTESMEGAGFMYACNMLQIKGVQIRGISNFVEVRNKSNWEIELAINNVNAYIIDYLAQAPTV